ATYKTKEQIRQEEAGLEEAIRLQAQMDKEDAKQIHLDKMLAKRVQEEQESSEQQLKRKAEKIDIEDTSIIKGKDEVVKEEEAEVPTAQDESEEEKEVFMKDKIISASSESEIGIDVIQTATKPPSIVEWKIIPQSGLKAVYQIIRRDGSDKIYMSFGAILKDFSRDDLTELYRLVIKKYGANRPEEMYDRVLWGDLKTMFDPPLSDDSI
ncbi:hypothetical protein Tco_1521079, partial [Tanacetum coccineum]